uniref:BPTI/Kunitz inhibitor domain-containing protein n=1 Tax=Ascaris lumbricoides TaxID=6252 RepID=A0A0M3IKJ4_ASCLU
MCLAFKYNGCGGNRNRFDTIHQCEFRCIPQDYGWCALSKEAYKDSGGQTRICFKRNLNNTQECPQGYACKMLAFFGVCCPKRTEGLFFFSLSLFSFEKKNTIHVRYAAVYFLVNAFYPDL